MNLSLIAVDVWASISWHLCLVFRILGILKLCVVHLRAQSFPLLSRIFTLSSDMAAGTFTSHVYKKDLITGN